MSDRQNNRFALEIWIPVCIMTSSRGSVKANSYKMSEFPNQQFKKNPVFEKINRLFQIVLKSEDRSFLPTVHLDFSWTLQMSDRQNHLTIWGVPWVLCVLGENSITEVFSKWKFDKISESLKILWKWL